MAQVIAESKEEFFNELEQQVRQRYRGGQEAVVRQFSRAYFQGMSIRELHHQQWDDLCGSLLSCWQFFRRFDGESFVVRVFNPSPEEDGWQSAHTILEVLSPAKPFLLDSVRMEIIRREVTIHRIQSVVVPVVRHGADRAPVIADPGDQSETVIHVEIDKVTDEAGLQEIKQEIMGVIELVHVVVDDFDRMRAALVEAREALEAYSRGTGAAELAEATAMLTWLDDNNFTYLGFQEAAVREGRLQQGDGSTLGMAKVLRRLSPPLEALGDEAVTFWKAPQRSRIHRPVYFDVVCVNSYDEAGAITGVRCFYGLFTARVYSQSPTDIPIVKDKVAQLLARADIDPGSHQGTEMLRLIEVLPREELFLAAADELYDLAMNIHAIRERRLVRVFVRRDRAGYFATCLMYMPRDVYNTQLRLRIQALLAQQFNAVDIDFTTYFSESILVRTYFEIRLDPARPLRFDHDILEERILQLTRTWDDDLKDALIDANGEEEGNRLIHLFRGAFPSSYRDDFAVNIAVTDIDHMMQLPPAETDVDALTMALYRSVDDPDSTLRFKLFHPAAPITLSQAIPILENMGTTVLAEHPYEIKLTDGQVVWIHDFKLSAPGRANIELHEVKTIFQEAFLNVWQGRAENDGFNRLVLGAEISGREVAILRAYARYMRQIRFDFSQSYIGDALARYASIGRRLFQLFYRRFNPELGESQRLIEADKVRQDIIRLLDDVENLADDRIIRRYMELIFATVRTNYFQTDGESGSGRPYVSFKFKPEYISDMPLPAPKYEVFVYSPRMEGVHLRGGKVARGGIRWSDRSEDYRTEILGLVKAQQVKNAVIVPVGAKGGFIAKQIPADGSRELVAGEGVACYRLFIRGLLDLADNVSGDETVHPSKVVIYDEDDPYLVVAADKGTATFSDIANELSLSYGFWLGDAFASGGSAGFDHKKMGITARGAWKSVEQHFRNSGVDIGATDFTVTGIGDMSGDVFGNGMLLSRHIRLVGAFNHQHVFIDPDPDPGTGFRERERLFALPRSTWDDYDRQLISKGGGVFSRQAKSITVSDEMKALLDLDRESVTPNQLVVALLKAEVDLLWNGGIGTYVKSREESNEEVGDRANDAVRVNAGELRCRVVGEGGNLGMTQLARVEFGLGGGRCFTDFIDNAGGVNCSDTEVNIKILLNEVVRNGDMTDKQRRELLEAMTDEVTELVLDNNYHQAQIIDLAAGQSRRRMSEYMRLIRSFEAQGHLDRSLEFIPTDEEFAERQAKNLPFAAAEISVLTSYSKNILKDELTASEWPEDEYLFAELHTAFPPSLVDTYARLIDGHQLRKEILATQLTNRMVNKMGMTFVQRLTTSTGADAAEITKAYVCAGNLFQVERLWDEIDRLDERVHVSLQHELMVLMMRLARKTTRWFLRNRKAGVSPAQEIGSFGEGVRLITERFGELVTGRMRATWQEKFDELTSLGVPDMLATVAAAAHELYAVPGIVESARVDGFSVEKVARVHYQLGERLDLDWVSQRVYELEVQNHWHAIARETFQDDLDLQQRRLAIGVMKAAGNQKVAGDDDQAAEALIEHWLEAHALPVERWMRVLADMRSSDAGDYAIYAVAIRELIDLAHATTGGTP